MGQVKLCILVLTVFCLAAFPAGAQQATPATPDRSQSPATSRDPVGTGLSERGAPPMRSTSKSKVNPAVADVTRVSTAEAARKAAKDVAQRRSTGTVSETSGTSEVLEFHPAESGSQGATVPASNESKKSALKNAHGDAYGALGNRGAGRMAGGSVGATSKSGKSSIYVQTDRETTPAPH